MAFYVVRNFRYEKCLTFSVQVALWLVRVIERCCHRVALWRNLALAEAQKTKKNGRERAKQDHVEALI